jgi:hypothetical protein
MRGKPPGPLWMGQAELSLGRFGQWPQRFPVATLILLPYCYPDLSKK